MTQTSLTNAGESKKSKPKARGWGRFFYYLFLIILAFIIGGFLSFAHRVDNQKRPQIIPKADGIVVWTGKGGGRLEAGASLLSGGYGERLLISGVNESNSREDILKLLSLTPELGACCVDLDYAARDTVGNARETAIWSEALGYEHIILVTSAYHMPRAEIEIGSARGRIRVTPYAVLAPNAPKWWEDGPRFRRMVQEYGKLLLTYIRRTAVGSDRGAPVLNGLSDAETENSEPQDQPPPSP